MKYKCICIWCTVCSSFFTTTYFRFSFRGMKIIHDLVTVFWQPSLWDPWCVKDMLTRMFHIYTKLSLVIEDVLIAIPFAKIFRILSLQALSTLTYARKELFFRKHIKPKALHPLPCPSHITYHISQGSVTHDFGWVLSANVSKDRGLFRGL
jgi:hypothetical protein